MKREDLVGVVSVREHYSDRISEVQFERVGLAANVMCGDQVGVAQVRELVLPLAIRLLSAWAT